VCGCNVAAQYLYDRSKPQPVYSFGLSHGDVSNKIDEEEEEDAEVDDDSDVESGLHNSSSQTNLIRQKLSAEDNGNIRMGSSTYYITRRKCPFRF